MNFIPIDFFSFSQFYNLYSYYLCLKANNVLHSLILKKTGVYLIKITKNAIPLYYIRFTGEHKISINFVGLRYLNVERFHGYEGFEGDSLYFLIYFMDFNHFILSYFCL